MLLQRTRADQVVPVHRTFAQRYPTPEALAKESQSGLLSVISPLGLRWRAPLMIRMAGIVADRGRPPERLEELTALPGVGPYAASAYLSLHRGIRAPIVDANVVRLYGRVFGFPTGPETRRKKWLLRLADEMTPRRSFRQFNYALLDLAMKVCVSRPKCEECPLSQGPCDFDRKRKR